MKRRETELVSRRQLDEPEIRRWTADVVAPVARAGACSRYGAEA
jgi:hypothetical protein